MIIIPQTYWKEDVQNSMLKLKRSSMMKMQSRSPVWKEASPQPERKQVPSLKLKLVLIGIYSMQSWSATTRYRVLKKKKEIEKG